MLNLVLDKEKAAEYGVDRVPAVIIAAPGCDRIRYYGAPLGNELPTLLQAINMAATGETDSHRTEPRAAESAVEARRPCRCSSRRRACTVLR